MCVRWLSEISVFFLKPLSSNSIWLCQHKIAFATHCACVIWHFFRVKQDVKGKKWRVRFDFVNVEFIGLWKCTRLNRGYKKMIGDVNWNCSRRIMQTFCKEMFIKLWMLCWQVLEVKNSLNVSLKPQGYISALNTWFDLKRDLKFEGIGLQKTNTLNILRMPNIWMWWIDVCVSMHSSWVEFSDVEEQV